MLRKDENLHVIYLPEPRRVSNEQVLYQGMSLNTGNREHLNLLWSLFKASVLHLSVHAATSDFEIYRDWAKDKDLRLAAYVASVLEDAGVRAYLRAFWPSYIPDIATANAISRLKMKPTSLILEDSVRVMASVLSGFNLGEVKGAVSGKMREDVKQSVALLRGVENLTYRKCLLEREEMKKGGERSGRVEKLLNRKRVDSADELYRGLSRYGLPSEVPSLPYTDAYGKNTVFDEKLIPTLEETEREMKTAMAAFGCAKSDQTRNASNQVSKGDEASDVFSMWQSSESAREKILRRYREIGAETHFRSVEFPEEDYNEYLRLRGDMAGPVRRILNKLKLVHNVDTEDFRREQGLLDLQAAIQVVASQSQRSDIFTLDEMQSREEAWAILVDASESLRTFRGHVEGILLSLAEVANDMILDQGAWGIYAFDDKFFVVKDFSEPYSTRVRARIAGLKLSGITYLPDGLVVAAEALKKHIEESKVLVVVSDGHPSGYENIEEKLVETVREIERTGIATIAIGIRSGRVDRYFSTHCTVENPYELMKKFVNAYLEYHSKI